MRLTILLLTLFFPLVVLAQKVKTVSGEYTYYAPENVSPEQARRIAIERARIEAIAAEFGTNVSQTNTTTVSNSNEQSETSFRAIGISDVKGDWLADTKEPEVSINFEGGMFVYTAKVEGKVRERKSSNIELQTTILCNGIESEKFKDKDVFTVRFKSAARGFLAIYLIDDNVEMAYCLLPYENEQGMAREILAREEYTLVSIEDPKYPPLSGKTIITTEKDIDFNRIVFIFSTTRFAMPLSNMGAYVDELSIEDFDKWLQRNRVDDAGMQIVQKTIEIRKK